MTTLSNARRAYREALSRYQEKTPSRTAILGDGRGTATSNVLVPGREDYVYARDDVTSTRFFQVLNQGAVQPAANLPVYVGYPFPTGTGSDEEQVIRINYSGLGDISSGTISPLGPHHQQHEFRGGDDILLDSRQFLPGLVHPTDPVSMKVQVESFIYFWDTWRRWEIAQSKALNEYLPDSGYVRWVMIALDPETGTLSYRPGMPFATGSQEVIFGTFTPIPAPAGNELPLGYVRLLSTTTTIDWTSSADNIGDARLWVNPPMLNILDRLQQLEGLSGNPPDLMMTGAATNPVSLGITLDSLYDVFVTNATDGQGLVFQSSTNTWIPGNAGGGITGTGTSGRVTRWNGTSSVTDSLIQDDGTTINVGGAPTSTRYFQIAQPVVTSGAPSALYVVGGAHTTLDASGEASDVVFLLNRIVQHNTGAIANQRAVVFTPPTYSFVGASTITTAATVAISGAPVAGTFATITTPLAFWVQAGNVLFASSLTVSGSLNVGSATGAATGVIYNYVPYTLSSSADVDGTIGTGFIIIIRDNDNGSTALVLYENSQTPTIISQIAGGTTSFVTGAPAATEIQIKDATGKISFRGGSSRNGTIIRVATLMADID